MSVSGLSAVWRAIAAGRAERAALRVRLDTAEAVITDLRARLVKVENIPAVRSHL